MSTYHPLCGHNHHGGGFAAADTIPWSKSNKGKHRGLPLSMRDKLKIEKLSASGVATDCLLVVVGTDRGTTLLYLATALPARWPGRLSRDPST
jgi:hypothetical protein